MRKWLVLFMAVATLALTVLAALFLVGMRSKSPLVQDRVRRFNRTVTNPRVLRSAGSPGTQTGVMRHVGRISGRAYQTPVGPFAVEDHYIIALPYGANTDWVRNVVAAGSATLVHEGRSVPVHMPEVVPTAEVIGELPVSQQRVLRVFGVDQCLRVRPVPTKDG